MSIRVVRIESEPGDGALRRLHTTSGLRPVLLAALAEARPVVIALCKEDLEHVAGCGDLIESLSERHRSRELHKILLGRKEIPLLPVGYVNLKRFRNAIAELYARAIARHDTNLFLIAVSAALFEELWSEAEPRAAMTMSPDFVRARSTVPAPGTPLVSMLPRLPIPPSVQEAFRGNSAGADAVRQSIVRVARSPQPVLILGETGTGKDVAARLTHAESGRRGPFVVLDCTNIPRDLLEGELFGSEKGAYTDAREKRDGRWLQANGGTLFLDEVGELTLDHQARLLRAIESGEIRRVGGSQVIKVDVRIIAATNRNLMEMVNAGTFRRDLYHRLHCLVIRTPPLREHPEDIPELARYFWQQLAGERGRPLPDDVLTELAGYYWPGNNRELLGALTTLFTMVGPHELTRAHVRSWMSAEAWAGEGGQGAPPSASDWKLYPVEVLRHLRRADTVMRQAQLPMRGVMAGAPATPDVRHGIATVTMRRVAELETLCETPALFHGAFDVVRMVKKQLRTFANKLPESPEEALAFWRSTLEPAFASAFAGIVKAIDELMAEHEPAVTRKNRGSRPPSTPDPSEQGSRL